METGYSSVQYQLRRIGDPATLERVKDILRFEKEVTTIGRHAHCDFFLDSAVLKNFISRKQAQIFQKGGECILQDFGLNGTYVNDVRVNECQVLKVGDVLKFGHVQGRHVKRGIFAPQPTKEFAFIFERAVKLENGYLEKPGPQMDIVDGKCLETKPDPGLLQSILKDSGFTRPASEQLRKISTSEEPEKENIKIKTELIETESEADLLAHSLEMVADSQDSNLGVSKCSPVLEISSQLSTHLKSSQRISANNTIEFPRISQSEMPSSPTIPVIGNSRETPTDLVKGYQPRRIMVETPKLSPVLNFMTTSMKPTGGSASSGQFGLDVTDGPSDADDVDIAKIAANAVNGFDSDEDIFDQVKKEQPTDEKPDILSPVDILKQVRAKLNSIENTFSKHVDFVKSPPSASSSFISPNSTTQSKNNTKDNTPGTLKTDSRQSISSRLFSSPPAGSQSMKFISPTGRPQPVPTKPVADQEKESQTIEALVSLGQSPPNFLNGPPVLTNEICENQPQLVRAQPTLNKLWSSPPQLKPQVPRSAAKQEKKTSTPKPVPIKLNKQPTSAETKAKRNAKRKSSGSSKSEKKVSKAKKKQKQADDEEEDERYDTRCDSYDCCEPSDPLITWVQCDDCDKWYHTSCAGCSYEQVQDEQTEFHCGCR